MAKPQKAALKIQQWGNSLAVRLPKEVARSAHFVLGQPVEVVAQDGSVVVKAIGEPRLTLAQKLAQFDLVKHGGETMATGRVGAEVF